MFSVLRLALACFVLLSIAYVSVLFYARAVQKDRLEAKWEASPQGDRDSFVRAGLDATRQSLRRKLILGVYIIPSLLLVTLIYLTNTA